MPYEHLGGPVDQSPDPAPGVIDDFKTAGQWPVFLDSAKKDSNGAETQELNVIRHNIELMNTQMKELLSAESWGGNASRATVDGVQCVCAGANGFIDNETGEIAQFTNTPRDNYTGGAFTFRIASPDPAVFYAMVKEGKKIPFEQKIIGIYSDRRSYPLSKKATEILEKSATHWNADHAQ